MTDTIIIKMLNIGSDNRPGISGLYQQLSIVNIRCLKRETKTRMYEIYADIRKVNKNQSLLTILNISYVDNFH